LTISKNLVTSPFKSLDYEIFASVHYNSGLKKVAFWKQEAKSNSPLMGMKTQNIFMQLPPQDTRK
jgi:hypothetical protein